MELFFLDQYHYLSEYSNVEAVYLFGSVARKENDEYSDIDILFIIEDCDEEIYYEFLNSVSKDLQFPISWISVYQKSKICEMKKKGSYFLWHIKLESVLLYSRSDYMEKTLNELPLYDGTYEDLEEYRQICLDIRASINEELCDYAYELSVLASLIRNTCIAICYLKGTPDFGRYSAVKKCLKLSIKGITFKDTDFKKLYNYRLWKTGKREFMQGEEENILFWICQAEKLIEFGMREIKRERNCFE